MPIIDQELFVACAACGREAATGIRRSESGLTEDPPGDRTIVCSRCGAHRTYSNEDYYHRTVESDREIVDV